MSYLQQIYPTSARCGQPRLPVLFYFFLVTFAFSSCDWFKPARDPKKDKVYKEEDVGELQGTKVFDPETGTWRTVHEVNEKVDTLKWSDLSEDKYPPIETVENWSGGSGASTGGNSGGNNSGSGNSGGSGKYRNVALVLPFLAQRFDTANIAEDALWAIHFYSGAKLAYDELERSGISLNINVLDDEATTGKMTTLLRGSEMTKADLIIGPYKRDNVALAADFSKKNKKPLIVPYTAQMNMSENNPNYIQVNPSLKTHCEAITRHARKRHRTEDIVLVARSKEEERSRLAYFQHENAVIEGRAGSNFREMIVNEDLQNLNAGSFVREGRTTVFIVPSWSSETFIATLFRQLMTEQAQGEDIVVYGMPQWMNFEQVDYEQFEKLNVHLSSASYVDNEDEKVRQFKRSFFDAYGTIPQEEAFLGYDVMLYFGRISDELGRDFTVRLDQKPYDVLHGRFEFERVVNEPERHREESNYYDQWENKFVHILKFKDFSFQPAD